MQEELFKGLNSYQAEAVNHGEGPMLVLAGPGTGKTRVITYRIASMIKNMGVAPREILAVTFTKKAAGEMKKRILKLAGAEADKTWIGTFHSICLRILRREIENIENYKKDFLIMSEQEEQKIFIKKCMRELDFSKKQPRISAGYALEMFDEAENSVRVTFAGNSAGQDLKVLYDYYKKELAKANFMTFNDLLLVTNRLLCENEEVLRQYQSEFSYILVDEYQDANIQQDKFVKLLSERHRNLFVVGDEDQSIYGWRGVDSGNILNFEKDFDCQKLVTLEYNYRSTQTILAIASGIIKKNSLRKEKKLRTQNPAGERAVVFRARNEREEGYFVANMISELVLSSDSNFSDVAVLYRANYQSRVVEDALRQKGISYVIKKGVRFYQREEIKDILAYLRFISNPKDQASFERIINVPHRGIARVAIDEILKVSENSDIGPVEAVEKCELPRSTREKLKKFSDVINDLRSDAQGNSVSKIIEKLIRLTKYLEHLGNDTDKVENVKELLMAAGEYGESTVMDFLDSVSLEPDEEIESTERGRVSLMTIHSSKGLEFSVVFLIGINEGLLPHKNSSSTLKGIEEERRLFYVALTRAEKMLCLSYSSPSLFLRDIPPDGVAYMAYAGGAYEDLSSYGTTSEFETTDAGLVQGCRVNHEFFGGGIIIEVENTKQAMRVKVLFSSLGGKRIVAVFMSTLNPPVFPLCKIKEKAQVVTNRSTALHECLLEGNTKGAFSLVEQGADINAQDEDGNTPLHLASLDGATELVSFLIEKGAQVNSKNKNGDTPLHLAVRAGKTEIASLLVECGADVNAQDEDGDTPLDDALCKGATQLASLLIEKGADKCQR